MKREIYLILTCLTISLCLKAQKNNCNSCICFANKSTIWKVEIDDKGKEYLVRGDSLKFIKRNIKQLILELNKKSKVQVKLLRLKNHIVYIKIVNSTLFTQTMGDAGADWYIASLIFTLTETPVYCKVYLDFTEGDHGGEPGLKSRKDFIRKYKICK